MAGGKREISPGKWELCISHGYDIRGRQIRRYKTVTVRTEAAADKELARFYVEVTGMPVMKQGKITFPEFVRVWQQRHQGTLSAKTRERIEQMLDSRIIPAFRAFTLDKVKKENILQFIHSLKNNCSRLDKRKTECLSDATIKMHYALLRNIFNKAVRWNYLSVNPCTNIGKEDLPRFTSRRFPVFQEQHLKLFLRKVNALKDNMTNIRYKLMVYLALLTGARRGEWSILTYGDVDSLNKTISINKACQILKGNKLSIKKPKTASSVRIINVDDMLLELIDSHKVYQDSYLAKKGCTNIHGYIFTAKIVAGDKETKPADPSAFYSWLKRFCPQHGLPRITVHSFRAMAATYALAAGVPLTDVQNMLGHASLSTTAIYLHSLEAKRKEAAKLLAGAVTKLLAEE